MTPFRQFTALLCVVLRSSDTLGILIAVPTVEPNPR
jgi:hypothetical protein